MKKMIPRLRTDLDVIPSSYQGEKVFLVRDFLGLIPQPVVLRGAVLSIIGLIDGIRSIRDIQVELMRLQGGIFVGSEDVESVISQLDRAFLLDSQHFRQEKERVIEAFRQNPVRQASLAGRAYADDPAELASYLQSILDMEKDQPDMMVGKKAYAIVAPHIDLDIGKGIYAKAYRAAGGISPEKILLLGTGHHLSESYFSLTAKDFVTPLGRVKTDKETVKRLKEYFPPQLVAPDDLDHKDEHSLEFQILFLQHLFGTNFRLLPVLCGSFQKELQDYSRPADIPSMPDFISFLRDLSEADEKSVLIVAGVDFSHIGPKFGHRFPATSLLLEAKEHDQALLDAVSRGDVMAFWSLIRKENNKYNVCGFSTLALLLELLSGLQGVVLGYDFWMEEATRSAVSFAALGFPAG